MQGCQARIYEFPGTVAGGIGKPLRMGGKSRKKDNQSISSLFNAKKKITLALSRKYSVRFSTLISSTGPGSFKFYPFVKQTNHVA